MCGRYAVYSSPKKIAKIFAIQQSFKVERSYNIAPTENFSTICALEDKELYLIKRCFMNASLRYFPKSICTI
jgi:putative SOS response-associated peptidase YedK